MHAPTLRRVSALAIIPALTLIFSNPGHAMISTTHLTTEYRNDPIGIDNPQPRLAWLLEGTTRGERQTAYRILVSSSPERLLADSGDYWDSGRIESNKTVGIRYGGRELSSHARCYWKVMAWDGNGKPGPWSEPAVWSMGILRKQDWRADWIGYDKPRQGEKPPAFSGAQWIWHGGDKPYQAPAGKRYFVRVLEIPAGKTVASARLAVAADDMFTLHLNGKQVATSANGEHPWRTPRYREVSSDLIPGKNVLYVEAENLAPGAAGFLFWLRMEFSDGTGDTLVSDRSWLSADVAHSGWRTVGPAGSEGKPPEALGTIGIPPWGVLDGSMLILPPPRYMGTTIPLTRPITRAVLYAGALGLCDVHINAARVSDDFFTPGWTDYSKRVYYRAYDVTGLLRVGENTVKAILADGWYSGHIGWGVQRDHYGRRPRLLAQLHVEYADGTAEEFGTGGGWSAWTGPTINADFLMGEKYDARLQANDVTNPGVPAGDPVDVGAEVGPVVEAHPGPPVVPFATILPKVVNEPRPGMYIFDMGQNFAGVVRIRVRGVRGQVITLRFAERLNPDGTLYTDNLRGAQAVDTYICKGDSEESWQPRFTFHGFQYVGLTGLTQQPSLSSVTGIALSSATPPAGSFECSEPMVNKLHNNILWTQRANFIDIPTDCPQRDERLGWTGDAQIYIRSACLNADAQAFFHKWLVDLEDAQRADGQFPMVAPLKVAGDDGGPAWADAGVICPWTIYDIYGDRDILEKHYPAMVRFVEFCRQRSTANLLPPGQFHCFGDWLNINAETPREVLYTAYFARCADLVRRAASVLGKKADEQKFKALFESIRAAFVSAYVDGEGHVRGKTQTGYVLALAFGLLDDRQSDQATAHLLADIEKRGWHLSTGFVGTKDLMLVLAARQRNDVAYRLLLNETFPSWGFTIRHGATSIWERWDGWTPEKGFQDPGMNSFAHYSFGAVCQWMVENIGGIRNDEPAFSRVTIAPQPGGKLTWARVAYQSVSGPILSRWAIVDGRITISVDVPANVDARVVLPCVGGTVLESGQPAGSSPGVKSLTPDTFLVGSGHYEFAYPFLQP